MVSLLLGDAFGTIGLVFIADTLIVLVATSHERVLVRVLAHSKAGDSDVIQGAHAIIG